METSFNNFASYYDQVMGESGDYTHQNTIDPFLFYAAGSIENKVIYDIGCGNGSVARKMNSLGAQEIWASDISSELINFAKTKYPPFDIKYFVQDGNDFNDIPQNYFDLVTLNMSIHYIKDINQLFANIYKILKVGGQIAFTTDHPLKPLAHFDEGRIKTKSVLIEKAKSYLISKDEPVFNHWTQKKDLDVYHRPLGVYLETLSANNFQIDKISEPKTKQLSSYITNQKVSSDIPAYIGIGAKKL